MVCDEQDPLFGVQHFESALLTFSALPGAATVKSLDDGYQRVVSFQNPSISDFVVWGEWVVAAGRGELLYFNLLTAERRLTSFPGAWDSWALELSADRDRLYGVVGAFS